ncbi:hypothetical protein N7528_000779 [Penicillium herquei]|nr:hypothetical protein N7528_000779 [Penicillium herquei]
MRFPIFSSLLCLAGLLSAPVKAEDESYIKNIPLRTHTLTSPYLDSDFQSRWFDFGGDTLIRADKYIRLTADRPSQQGWIFSRVPLTATNWQIELEFEIHGAGTLHGDGFALWLTKQRATQGPVFGSTDKFEGLGIFFDTYKNNRPGVTFPYVMAMMGDGETSYDQAHDGKGTELAGCSARGLRNAPVPTKARLTYFQDKSLSLELQYKTEDSWVECFSLNAEDANIAIPSVAYLGLSAETGELSDNHDIVSIKVDNLYTVGRNNGGGSRGSDNSRGRGRSGTVKPKKKKSSWTWFLFKTLMFLGAIVGAYFGWTVYRTKSRSSRF